MRVFAMNLYYSVVLCQSTAGAHRIGVCGLRHEIHRDCRVAIALHAATVGRLGSAPAVLELHGREVDDIDAVDAIEEV